MALLVPNWNPSNEHTGPPQMLSWLFQAPSVSSHDHMTKSRDLALIPGPKRDTYRGPELHKSSILSLRPSNPQLPKCQNVPAPIPSGFAFREIRMQGISLLLGIPGCRNAEMPQCLFFRVFAFHEIWVQGISLLLGIPGCRNAEIPMTRDL
jgi:hypothetical protein